MSSASNNSNICTTCPDLRLQLEEKEVQLECYTRVAAIANNRLDLQQKRINDLTSQIENLSTSQPTVPAGTMTISVADYNRLENSKNTLNARIEELERQVESMQQSTQSLASDGDQTQSQSSALGKRHAVHEEPTWPPCEYCGGTDQKMRYIPVCNHRYCSEWYSRFDEELPQYDSAKCLISGDGALVFGPWVGLIDSTLVENPFAIAKMQKGANLETMSTKRRERDERRASKRHAAISANVVASPPPPIWNRKPIDSPSSPPPSPPPKSPVIAPRSSRMPKFSGF